MLPQTRQILGVPSIAAVIGQRLVVRRIWEWQKALEGSWKFRIWIGM